MGIGRQAAKGDRLALGVDGGFAWIAAWQLLVFVLLLLLIWVNEMLDITALLFQVPRRAPDTMRACMASAGLLIGAVILVGNTYLQQRRLVKGLLTICSYCKRIRLPDELWQRIEEYIGRRSSIQFTHSVCPDCLARAKEEMDNESENALPRRQSFI